MKMNRWERKFREKPESDLVDLDSQGNPPESLENSGGGTETGFTLSELKGKSPAEIEQAFRVYKSALGEQGNRLSELEEQVRTRPVQQQAPVKEDEQEVSSEEFWQAPMKNVAYVVERVVQKQLAQIVGPLQAEMAEQKAGRVWEELYSEFDDAQGLKPLMDQILRNNGITNPNLATLKSTYFMAVGMASRNKNNNSGDNAHQEHQTTAAERPMRAMPQHRPASQPLENAAPKKPGYRKLTESERVIARGWNMTDEQYLDELARDNKDMTPTAAKK